MNTLVKEDCVTLVEEYSIAFGSEKRTPAAMVFDCEKCVHTGTPAAMAFGSERGTPAAGTSASLVVL